jgi:DNA polymerase-3 subunit delta'
MELKDVIGQSDLKQQLINMVQQNRLGHALLMVGKEGTDALPLALAFAQWVVRQPAQYAQSNSMDLFCEPDPLSNTNK